MAQLVVHSDKPQHPPWPLSVTAQNPIPPSEKLLFTFKNSKDIARWNIFTDQEFGGQSEAALALSDNPPVRGTAFGSCSPCNSSSCTEGASQCSAVFRWQCKSCSSSTICIGCAYTFAQFVDIGLYLREASITGHWAMQLY